jgi:uncharacterized iron-regulated protein
MRNTGARILWAADRLRRLMRPAPSDLIRCTRALLLAMVAGALLGCASAASPYAWESRLTGDAVVLLGEVHDNPEQHRLRLGVLRRAFAAGWRPALAMEQFDVDRQADIERARRERPGDARYLIEQATTPPARPGEGWNWDHYRPVVELALAYDLPLLAANLSSADARRIARGGLANAFDERRLAALELDRPVAPDWQQAQEREIDRGHCGALPTPVLPRMAQAQLARDAVMADLVRRHAARGLLLLAGNGHVRRDIGVPRWLAGEALSARLLVVGLLEEGEAPQRSAAAFDAELRTAVAERTDPCAQFRARPR